MLGIWALSALMLWYTVRQWRRARTPRRRRMQLLFMALAAAWLVWLGLWVVVPLIASWLGELAAGRK